MRMSRLDFTRKDEIHIHLTSNLVKCVSLKGRFKPVFTVLTTHLVQEADELEEVDPLLAQNFPNEVKATCK